MIHLQQNALCLVSQPNGQWAYKESFIKVDGGAAAIFLQRPHCDGHQEHIGEITGEGQLDCDKSCQFLSQCPAREENRVRKSCVCMCVWVWVWGGGGMEDKAIRYMIHLNNV